MQNENMHAATIDSAERSVNNKIVLFQFGNPAMILTARYLSGILRAKGYDTTIVSITPTYAGVGATWAYSEETLGEEAIRQMQEMAQGALFVGIVLFTFEAHITKRFYESFKKLCPAMPVVVGGPHATLDPHHASQMSDYVCIGDGEQGIVEIAEYFQRRNNQVAATPAYAGRPATPESVCTNIYQSAWIRNHPDFATSIVSHESPCLADIIPTFAFDAEYNISDKGLIRVTPETAPQYIETYATFLSRGCVNNCAYCCHEILANKSGFLRRIKSRQVRSVIEELLEIKKNYLWVKRVVFCDPNILSNKREVIAEFLQEYKQHINLPFTVTGFTFNQMTEDVLRSFLDAGLAHLTLGIQSGAEQTRILLGRNFETLDMIRKRDALMARLKKRHYFSVQYDIILDVPWEESGELRKSIVFVSRLRAYNYLDIFSLRLLPMTKLFMRAVNEGMISFADKEAEYRKTYRAIQCGYENFLFILLRQRLLGAVSTRLLISWPLVNIMSAVFRTALGAKIFNGVIHLHKTKIGKLFLRLNSALVLLPQLGIGQWLKLFYVKFKTLPFRRWLGND